jgi:2,4-dienoyl-CoA reductase-like NADH-dependent reductase (Old Yellow Enzyme family)
MARLFEPTRLGAINIKNRVIMAPMTRARAVDERVPNDAMREYYQQRASAGLILTEATSVSPQGVGYPDTPGIWSHKQMLAWRKIVHAVHDKGGKIMLQLWHVGRVSDPDYLNGEIPVAPSAIRCEGFVKMMSPPREYVMPRSLHPKEIKRIVADFAEAARNAKEADFDGVELHAANGYLIDQFLRDSANQRTDDYGGSIANRARLLLEITDSCVGVWGSDRVGVHLSPHHTVHSVSDSNTGALFSYVARQLGRRRLAFLCVREAEDDRGHTGMIRRAFGGPVVVNGGYDLALADQALDQGRADAVAFGRPFIANPDLVARLRSGAALNADDENTYYGGSRAGYTDYPVL